jgi:hypothetical protein
MCGVEAGKRRIQHGFLLRAPGQPTLSARLSSLAGLLAGLLARPLLHVAVHGDDPRARRGGSSWLGHRPLQAVVHGGGTPL